MFLHPHLEIHQRENEGIAVLDLSGKLEMDKGDIALREFVESLLAQGNKQLILNLAHVSAIDTAGAGVLLVLAQQYQAAGGRLVLMQVNHAHAKIYEMARLESVIEIYSAETDAVNSFFPDRAVTHYDILDYVETQAPHESQNDKK